MVDMLVSGDNGVSLEGRIIGNRGVTDRTGPAARGNITKTPSVIGDTQARVA